MKITRCDENPIVRPGKYDWRKAVTFNPAVILEGDTFYMLERVSGGLRPFYCYFGLLKSEDGVHFEHVVDEPVFTPSMLGFPYGSIQDPRMVKIEDTYYVNYALRPSSFGYSPTGVGKPTEHPYDYPGEFGKPEMFLTRSGILKSKDLIHYEQVAYTTPFHINDRDNILFPEKINGRYALLRRPEEFIGEEYGTEKAAMWITFSDDLVEWDEPQLLATARDDIDWEYKKVGGSTPPIRTEEGWLVLYHGVDRDNVYRAGAMMLDIDDPTKVIARPEGFIMEPEEYYEKFGLYIPNVVFPTGNVVKGGLLYIYYGCTDTAISLATVPLKDLVDFVMGR